MIDTLVADSAIKALKMKHDRPFFIACGLFHPHMPWYVPKKYFDLYPLEKITLPPVEKDDLNDIPELGKKLVSSTYQTALEHKKYRQGVQAYLATTTYADYQMGRVLKALEESPYKENTMVILISDHGFHVGEKHHWQKGSLWEEAANSLMMFRVPGITRAKQVCSSPVSLMDLYPTIAELIGLKKPSHVDGNSLVPVLRDVTTPHDYPIVTAYQNHVSVRTKQHRLIQYEDGSQELYDLTKDPGAFTNLAGKPAVEDVQERLAKLLPKFKMLDRVDRSARKNQKEKK